MTTTSSTSPLRRRLVVIATGTLAVGALAAVAPTPVIEAASAATATSVPTSTVTGTAPAVGTAPAARTAPAVATRVSVARMGAIAPYRFGTVNFNKWWAKRLLVTKYHVSSATQFGCLVTVWNRESHWNHKAHNHRSGAHGIPQALPGSKMRSAGADWRTNPITQITWGLGYIHSRYGTPCGALRHMNSHGWY